jgi:hypothetical protein
MPFSIDKSELERHTSELDQEEAADLRGALGWFGADEDGPTVCVSRHDLQQFLHYTLPRRYLVEVEEQIAVARALGDALEHLGAPREYVDLCRAPETIALIRLWAVDEDAAFGQFAAFADASGLARGAPTRISSRRERSCAELTKGPAAGVRIPCLGTEGQALGARFLSA